MAENVKERGCDRGYIFEESILVSFHFTINSSTLFYYSLLYTNTSHLSYLTNKAILIPHIQIHPNNTASITSCRSLFIKKKMSLPRIAIIGAGPGGLTLATILRTHHIPCTIFEHDVSRFSRDQGGSVDLHADMAQLALKEAGLLPTFKKFAIPGAEAMKLVKADGTVCWDENDAANYGDGADRDRPEIDRKVLRDILLDSIEEENIKWGRKLMCVKPNREKYDLHFDGGVVETGFDLVVGADGAWSKVRPLLTDAKPIYSGISMVELQAFEATEKKPWLSKYMGAGSLFMFDEGRAIICQRNGNDTIRVYAAVRQPETWIEDCGIDWTQPNTARKELVERYFSDCGKDLKRVVEVEAADKLITRPLYMLPVGLKWEPRAGVTVLGDAAHLMTPFAGIGVNLAMNDALGLAMAITKRKDEFGHDLKGALAGTLKEYEEKMFAVGKAGAEKTAMGLKGHFSAGGVEHRVALLKKRAQMIVEHRAEEEAKKRAELK
jgi:2-polyprenyl-6-methoxyphenol hydroxylase-like FAD-dependent oxidoreductase